jgi:hypothetical protein
MQLFLFSATHKFIACCFIENESRQTPCPLEYTILAIILSVNADAAIGHPGLSGCRYSISISQQFI